MTLAPHVFENKTLSKTFVPAQITAALLCTDLHIALASFLACGWKLTHDATPGCCLAGVLDHESPVPFAATKH